jgi:hypothetical protein
MPRLLPCLLLLTLSVPAIAQVYKHVDEDGNITFTDQPPPNSTPVEIREPNSSSPPPVIAPAPAVEAGEPVIVSGYDIAIISPAMDTIIPRGPGNFSVSASLSPALKDGHQLQLLMDGTPREARQTSPSWALTNVFRGAHELTVAVVDKKGKQISISAPVTVYVFRPSSNF